MLASFFIDRPILAWVISIVIVLLGALAALFLPISQYPDVTPPTVRVTASYPGANAKVVAETVAAPIEQQVNGVEKMMYMSSQSVNDGTYTLDVTFELGTNIDTAQVQVQNRVQIAQPSLPDRVKAIGVTVKKQSPTILLVINLYSDDDPATGKPYYDQLYMSNYATINLRDPIARLDGVGDVLILGQQDYSMRVWLDPDKLTSRNLTAGDVVKVLQEQNVQVAAGSVGQPPVPLGQDFQYTLSTLGRLTEAAQFADIVLKTGTDGQVTYLRDVARVQMGAKNQDQQTRLDGKPSAGAAAFQLPGSNALDTANLIYAKMRELEKRFPRGLHYQIAYDTTPFVRASVNAVVDTLRDAVLLVALVVLVFLQDWKSLLLPIIDVAVSLVGTFAVMQLLGFSFNNLTLFGLVLAIGIVVDDSIVVLENIERWLEKGLPVREATIKAMGEITGPIFAITLVLSSVLLPSAFLGGLTGQFFRQFALTISVAMVISAINAMTMTPARAGWVFGNRQPGADGHMGKEVLPWWSGALFAGLATLWILKRLFGDRLGIPNETDQEPVATAMSDSFMTWGSYAILFLPGALVGGLLGWFLIRYVNQFLGILFRGFNWGFNQITAVYGASVGWMIRLALLVMVIYAGLIGLAGFLYTHTPTGFIPTQDKGYLLVNVKLSDAASLERTVAVNKAIERIAAKTPGVAHSVTISGLSFIFNANNSNFGTAFIILKPFEERRDAKLSGEAITAQLREDFAREIPEAQILVFGAPAVDGLGNAGGFKLMVESTGDTDYANLQAQADNLAAKGRAQPGLVGVFNSFSADTPQLFADVDRTKVKTMNVPLTDVFDALQIYMGGYYVNDFNRFGRTWQVNVQADARFRKDTEALKQMTVRNGDGDMVPLGAVVRVRDEDGPVFVTRYNMNPAAAVYGASLPFISSGEALHEMELLSAKELPPSMFTEWSDISYLQSQAGKTNSVRAFLNNPNSAFVLGVILVFFVLAGLYESWSLPLAVILVMPMCILSALVGIMMARMDINIFVQVGFVVLIGLAAKNAILIVEFARDRELEGVPRNEAAVEAAKVRLRPIIMTSFAFILGVLPLVIAEGAGAEMRRTLGTAVFAGMLGVTLFGIFLVPIFYSVVRRFAGNLKAETPASQAAAADGHMNQH